MTLFWIISAAMIVAALGLLAPTLLRKHEAATDDTKELNVEIAREHLQELTKQKDAGELSKEEFDQAKKDLETALAHDLVSSETPAPTAKAPGGGRAALLLSVVLVPLIAIPTYLEIGSPGLIERPAVAQGPSIQGELPPISELAAQLRERMEANPDNPEGWFLLGRTYMRLGDYDGAVYAFEQVVQRLPEEVAALLSLADALILQNDRKVPELAENLLQRALEIEPDSVTALWLLGNAAADKGDNTTALEYWEKAYPMLDSEPQMQADLGQMIRVAGGTVPEPAPALPPIMPTAEAPTETAQAPAPVASAEDLPPTGAAQAGGDGASIGVEVALAPHLMERADPGDTVFVLARAENGPPMPLAVARHQVSELPLSIQLTDAMAMMPAMRLSAFPRVSVTAKVSKSGQAGTQPGDLLADAIVVDQSQPGQGVQLLINQVAN